MLKLTYCTFMNYLYTVYCHVPKRHKIAYAKEDLVSSSVSSDFTSLQVSSCSTVEACTSVKSPATYFGL